MKRGCDLLILLFNIKRSQPSAAPTGAVSFTKFMYGPPRIEENTMSHLTIVPLSSALGAQISGIDISQPLNLQQHDAIEQALLKHQVLFFRDQPIEPQQQARFAAYFGDLHIHPIYPNVPEQPEVLILDTAVTDVRDNAIWHTDVTFLPTPAMGAVLSAKLLPEFGGDTLWASGIAAYEALSAPMKNLARRADRHSRFHPLVPAGALWQYTRSLGPVGRSPTQEPAVIAPGNSHAPGKRAPLIVRQ